MIYGFMIGESADLMITCGRLIAEIESGDISPFVIQRTQPAFACRLVTYSDEEGNEYESATPIDDRADVVMAFATDSGYAIRELQDVSELHIGMTLQEAKEKWPEHAVGGIPFYGEQA